MKKNNYFALKFDNDKFTFIDQTKLPFKEDYIETADYERIAEAIEKLEIRGAPAIGIAAAYGLALSVKIVEKNTIEKEFENAYKRLSKTRPTAVNLFYALDCLKEIFDQNKDSQNVYQNLLQKAEEIHKDDIDKCEKIGKNGLNIFNHKSIILTHCNTGKLATGGNGTAFNVIKKGYENNLVKFVYANETRPLFQGSRLTAFELEKNGIPFAVQSDSSAASAIKNQKIDFAIVGADRIALNGDTANKIGTYNLAILCSYHSIPFYVAAPSTTIDKKIAAGNEIEIEIRNKLELLSLNGNPISLKSFSAYAPAFDITPSHLITGIITEKDIYYPPYNFIYE